MARLFISYAREDRNLAGMLRNRLAAAGHSIFMDTAIPGGADWEAEVVRALSESEWVLVLLSVRSVTSDFVREEVRRAYATGKLLLPIRICFEKELPFGLGAMLNRRQCLEWESHEDNDDLVRQILSCLEGAPEVSAPPPPGSSLLADNWLLQEAGSYLGMGLLPDQIRRLEVGPGREPRWMPVPMAGIQLEAVISLITEIVLREYVLVDMDFAHAWSGSERLAPLAEHGIIREVDFRRRPELPSIRQRQLDLLCATPGIRRLQDENEQQWQQEREHQNSRASAIIWGTAGYLARAQIGQVVYTGHPLRKHFIGQVLRRRGWEARAHLDGWLQRNRIRLFGAVSPDHEACSASLVVPPIAVEVIEACSSLEALIPTALQAREHYAKLRGWISTFQRAFEEQDPRALLKHKKELEAAAREMDRQLGDDTPSESTHIGFRNVSWYGGTQTRASTRTILSELLFAKSGESSLQRLLQFAGEKHGAVGREAVDYLRTVSAIAGGSVTPNP